MTRTFAASGSVWPIKALVPDSPLVNMCMSTFVLALCACVASEKQAQDNLNACVVYCKKINVLRIILKTIMLKILQFKKQIPKHGQKVN